MVRDWDTVTVGLKVDEEARILCRSVGPFDGFWAFDEGLYRRCQQSLFKDAF